jgi:hypothetical protein
MKKEWLPRHGTLAQARGLACAGGSLIGAVAGVNDGPARLRWGRDRRLQLPQYHLAPGVGGIIAALLDAFNQLPGISFQP